jgi:ATP-dependent DNA helicase PIF1
VVEAYLWVIEYQKRGLPHAHLVLMFAEHDKLTTPEAVDRIICAEIPDKTVDPELYQIVKKCMVHGPCTTDNCLKKPFKNTDGSTTMKCVKRFPYAFAEHTIIEDDTFPIYRRRDDGRTVYRHGQYQDNQMVVPYNPYLTRRYRCHINVHQCRNLHSIKYIFKYVTKGSAAANVQIDQQAGDPLIHDEIHQHEGV